MKGISSLHANHVSVSVLPAPRSPAAPQGVDLHCYETHWPAPETMRVNSHDCLHLDPNHRGKMAQGTNPLLQNEQSSDPCPLLLFLDLRVHKQFISHTEWQRCSCPQRFHSCIQRWQILFLLQVRLIPDCRNTYFAHAPFPQRQHEFY